MHKTTMIYKRNDGDESMDKNNSIVLTVIMDC